MGLRDLKRKIGSLFHEQRPDTSRSDSARDFVEGRIHERYPVCFQDAITITTEKNEVYRVLNISFGGFAASVDHGSGSFYSRGQNAKIEFLGGECPAIVHKVYQGPGYIGFRFEHRDEKTLIFLREILEYLRLGTTLHILRKEFLTKEYQSESWIFLRGEGPSDLSFHISNDGTPDQVYFSFRSGESTNKVRYSSQSFSAESSDITLKNSEIHLVKIFLIVVAGISDHELSKQLRPVYESGLEWISHKDC